MKSSRAFRRYWRVLSTPPRSALCPHPFHTFAPRQARKPILLTDIGEGIRECEIIQWFVQPEARVEEFDPLCEVQSDKASVEITSRYGGVIKKLHYEAGQMAAVGKPLLDIETPDAAGDAVAGDISASLPATVEAERAEAEREVVVVEERAVPSTAAQADTPPPSAPSALATPAVRHLTRQLDLDIRAIAGSGKQGRVLKEDVLKHAQEHGAAEEEAERRVALTPMQAQMFRSMAASLSIPHFLYADEVCFDGLAALRAHAHTQMPHLTYLPLIIKAISLALTSHPLLNARLDTTSPTAAAGAAGAAAGAQLVFRRAHNIGIAMATPAGLAVPVLHDVGGKSIARLAAELSALRARGAAGTLSRGDLSGGTITVSNIGAIGGTYVAPRLVEGQVAIVGIGRARAVPAFDAEGALVRRLVAQFSWCADHRAVDGAQMARMAEEVRGLVEQPDKMLLRLR
ncbi:MAG: hypothetical protein M1829_001708 [Trizodia sp. TS-e1964]|nr:MAG: hypothetical protein M1829_001708 [Trizodia sp. TS-e1964]